MAAGGSSSRGVGASEEPREMLWPPNGYVFEQEFMLPAYCKPKICPLKSVTLEKLEKMQAEAGQRLKEMEQQEREAEAREKEKAAEEGDATAAGAKKADIWRADEEADNATG